MGAARTGLIAAGLLLVVGAGMGRCSVGDQETVTKYKTVTVPTVVTHTETKIIEKPFPPECKRMVTLTEGYFASMGAAQGHMNSAMGALEDLAADVTPPQDASGANVALGKVSTQERALSAEIQNNSELGESLRRAKEACEQALSD